MQVVLEEKMCMFVEKIENEKPTCLKRHPEILPEN